MKRLIFLATVFLPLSMWAHGVIEHKSCEILPDIDGEPKKQLVQQLKSRNYTQIKMYDGICKFWCGLAIGYKAKNDIYSIVENRHCERPQCDQGTCYYVELWRGKLEDLPSCHIRENKSRAVYNAPENK